MHGLQAGGHCPPIFLNIHRTMHTKNLLFAAFLAVSPLLSGCFGEDCVRGQEAETEVALDLADFTEIELSGQQTVVLRQTSDAGCKVSVKAPADLQGLVKASVSEGGVLKIWNEGCLQSFEQVQITVQLPSLRRLSASGIGAVTTEGTFQADVLALEVRGATALDLALDANEVDVACSGASAIELRGGCEMLRVKNSGASAIDASALKAARASISISGAGACQVHAIESLHAEITGMGLIEYSGSPEVTKRISGLGEIKAVSAGDSTDTDASDEAQAPEA
jgi:hypothetical protein